MSIIETILIDGQDVSMPDLRNYLANMEGLVRKNAVINGAFNIWSRATSFASVASGAYTADGWSYSKTGTMIHTVGQSGTVPTVAEAGRLFSYSLLLDCTTADVAIAAGDHCSIQHRIEGYNWLPLAQQVCTLSFWVRGTKTGIHCVAFRNAGANRSFVAEYNIGAPDTWELKTIAITASPAAGTWDYTTGVGLIIDFSLAAGTTHHTTAGVWQTGSFLATANQVNATDSISNDFRIAAVQLEAGSVATAFEPLTIQEERGLCLNYLWVIGGIVRIAVGQAYSSTNARFHIQLPRPMRSAPSFLVSSSAHFDVTNASAARIAVTALVLSASNNQFVELDATVASGLVAGHATHLVDDGGASGTIYLSAEL